MKKAYYICFEGAEGLGKTTQTQRLVDYLRDRGFSVLQTKEPGTPHSPLTMKLREIMLDNQYDQEMTKASREFVSQAIRSIHLEKVIVPALASYDFIVQDRGILSGLSYGEACGNSADFLDDLTAYIMPQNITPYSMYDAVIYLKGNIKEGLDKALSAKQEFETGDAMEARGVDFISNASRIMDNYSSNFNTVTVYVDGKSIDQVFDEIITRLDLKTGANNG